ncbi:alanine racemase [Rhodococcus opacus PD630]|nr:Alanine racemase [Rhodococcus opacus PD630]EHI43148.1 alanine racemase [Rhodococcus opacus PD630]UDG94050.1 alanine racemase [Rhodococcus opacus PD630]
MIPARQAVSGVPAPQAEAVIDLDAIAHNIRILREHAGNAGLMAVVKADGYNHGGAAVAAAALAAGAREIGVPSTTHLLAIAAAASALGKPATIAIKVDTGLNRNGASPREYPLLLDEIVRLTREGTVRLRTIFSHLAHADEPGNPVLDTQRQRFLDAIATAQARGLEPEVVHLANSAATLSRPDLHFDLVRPGIAVYGLTPVPELGTFGLIPAMTVRTRVALVKEVAAGEGVSYGHGWIAPRDTVVALLPAGYADGIPRALGGKFDVLLGGVRRPGIGRVCMDQVVVDLGPDGGGVREGDHAVFFGNGRHGEPVAQDWADALGTIHY